MSTRKLLFKLSLIALRLSPSILIQTSAAPASSFDLSLQSSRSLLQSTRTRAQLSSDLRSRDVPDTDPEAEEYPDDGYDDSDDDDDSTQSDGDVGSSVFSLVSLLSGDGSQTPSSDPAVGTVTTATTVASGLPDVVVSPASINPPSNNNGSYDGADGTFTTTSQKKKGKGSSSNSGKSWHLASSLTSVSDFKSSFKFNSFSWGADLVSIVQSVPQVGYNGGGGGSALMVKYPKGSWSPSHRPQGGVGFYASPIDISSSKNVSFSYSVFFPSDFDFVKGGKLPGLYGGHKGCSGGAESEDCFSTRLMWRTNGAGEMYLYAPKDKQPPSVCSIPPVSYCNADYGFSLGRGSWYFQPGQWTDVRQDVWMNTPGKANGGFNVWVNGNLALSSNTIYYRNAKTGLATTLDSKVTTTVQPEIGFLGVQFDTFFGGSTSDWAPSKDLATYFNRCSITINS